jgi:hypothetical protein
VIVIPPFCVVSVRTAVGEYEQLEDQMAPWTPEEVESPDRLDAMVQGFADLLGTISIANYFNALANFCPKCGLPMPKSMSHCSKCGTAMIVPEKEGI